jgi:two-component system sensor histidine kinase KdpD
MVGRARPSTARPGREATRRGAGVEWVAWLGALASVTGVMAWVRGSLGTNHVVLAYLLVVLGASARGGRALGVTVAVIAFACFNYYFVQPYHTFTVAAPLDWLVLFAFLATSIVAAQLLDRAQADAADARRRTEEVDRLAALGAEALNAGRAEEALGTVADVIRTTLELDRVEIYLRDGTPSSVALVAGSGDSAGGSSHDDTESAASSSTWTPGAPDAERLVAWVAERGESAARRPDGTLRFGGEGRDGGENELDDLDGLESSGVQVLVLPLRVHDRTVGALRLVRHGTLRLDAPQRRFLRALSYYAALGADRVRLLAEAEHASGLREADRLKDALLASVSHDLRTPLTTIKALAHQMRTEGGDERAAIIEEEADRLNRFVADLLDLSRLAGGALVVTPEVTAAEDLVGAALQRVSGVLGDRALDVSLDPAETLLLGRFDFVHSLRVLVNLLENAIKYSPADTRVELVTRRVGDRLEFAVSDHGCGVPPAEHERIFEPFYRPSGAPADTGSAGLGLSIARRLAEAQGGSLTHEPRAEGGSRFVFTVPAVDVADLPALAGERRTSSDAPSL